MSISKQNVIHTVINIILIILWILFVKFYSSKTSSDKLYRSLTAKAVADNDTRLPQMNVSNIYGNDSSCNKRACVRKCCPEGESLKYSDDKEIISCVKTNKSLKFIELPFLDDVNKTELLKNDNVSYVFGFPCPNIIFRKRVRYSYNLSAIGKLHDDEDRKFINTRYCIDKLIKDNVTSIAAFTCHTDIVIYDRFFLYLSLICFFITFLVSAILPELRNTTFGLCLMSHTASLFLAYLTIALNPVYPTYFEAVLYEYAYESAWYIYVYHVKLKFLRYSYLIFYYAGFFWINVICFDIWRTLWKMAPTNSSSNQNRFIERKRFLIYSLLSWFTPVLFCINHFYLHGTNPTRFQDCYCNGRKFEQCALFLGPLGISVLANMVFFGHTLYIIKKTWRQTGSAHESRRKIQKTQNNQNNNYERLSVCAKLFIIMGIPYILELSYFVFQKHLKDEFWYLPDITRSLQGLLILTFFVLKRRTIKLLYHKYSPIKCSTISDFLSTVVTTKSGTASEDQIGSSMELQENARFNKPII